MIEAISPTTFKAQIGGNEVRIGDAKAAAFRPHLWLPKWDEECWISLTLAQPGKPTSPRVEGGFLKAGDPAMACAWRPTGVQPGYNDQGGLDWLITLNRQPPRSYLEFEYDSHQVAAYHQPELTLEEVKQGCVRPEHVINSVAFYHSARAPMHRSKSDAAKYKTCKIGHLYRVKVQDAKGHTTWADWSVEHDGILRLSVDPTWLTAAAYPVVLAPAGDTFGYTSVGGSAEALSGSTYTWAGYLAAAPADGSVTAIHSHMRHNTDGYYVRGIMANTTPAIVTNGIGTAGVPFAYSGSTSVWHELPFASSPSVTKDTSYYIGWCSDTASGTWRISYDGGGTTKIGTCDYAAPDTITVKSTNTDREYSIYCTYTPSGGAETLYTAQALRSITRAANYEAQTVRSVTRTAGYAAQAVRTITRAAEYAAQAVRAITRPATYEAQTQRSVTRPASYMAQTQRSVTRAASYAGQAVRQVTRAATYEAQTVRTVTRATTYAAQAVRVVTRPASYIGQAVRVVTREARYIGQTARVVTKSASYIAQTLRVVTRPWRGREIRVTLYMPARELSASVPAAHTAVRVPRRSITVRATTNQGGDDA